MIRVVLFLVAAGLLALGVVWLADRPGQIAITWLGYRTDASVMVAIVAIVAFAVAIVMLWSLVRFMLRSPKLFSLAWRERKSHRRSGMLDRATFRRQRAVLLTARALAVEEQNRDAARTIAVEATKLVPDLVPAATLAGRLLAEAGERRKAGKILEAAWKANPH